MIRLLAAIAIFLSIPGLAHAHLLPKQNATIKISDRSAYVVVSVPLTALNGVDDDGDGLLSLQELQRHSPEIQAQFESRFRVSQDGRPGVAAFSWVAPPDADVGPAGSDYVVVLHRADFDQPLLRPQVETDLFGTRADEARMTLRATLGQTVEVAILEPGAQSHRFFRGKLAIFLDFIRIGTEHIWTGADHLLFLVTMLLVSAGRRYWLSVVTGFTIGHSITLTLAALGLLRLPAAIVEPGIAASIVALALLNLRSLREHSVKPPGQARIIVVFACGLLHGCGFGSAIGSMGVDFWSRLATLGGFNIGIEIGQFLFVGVMLAVTLLVRRSGFARWSERIPQIASLAAVVIGSLWFIQRIGLI